MDKLSSEKRKFVSCAIQSGEAGFLLPDERYEFTD